MSCLINHKSRRQTGFTLLEMIVVLLLVSMLSGLLMQGFLYMSRIYGVVDREQNRVSTTQLLDGWIRNSARGLINGFDEGNQESRIFFEGDSDYFRGLTLTPILGNSSGGQNAMDSIYVPYLIEFRLERNGDSTELVYGESMLSENNWQWFTLGTWQTDVAEFSYRSDGSWSERFPVVGSVFGYNRKALPEGISLYLEDGRDSYEIFVTTGSDSDLYRPVQDTQGGIF